MIFSNWKVTTNFTIKALFQTWNSNFHVELEQLSETLPCFFLIYLYSISEGICFKQFCMSEVNLDIFSKVELGFPFFILFLWHEEVEKSVEGSCTFWITKFKVQLCSADSFLQFAASTNELLILLFRCFICGNIICLLLLALFIFTSFFIDTVVCQELIWKISKVFYVFWRPMTPLFCRICVFAIVGEAEREAQPNPKIGERWLSTGIRYSVPCCHNSFRKKEGTV